eukprot:2771650-Amphidinium_carterae.1
MADDTEYADEQHTPQLPLRQLFVAARVPNKVRRLFGDWQLLSVDHVASMADSLDGFKAVVRSL